MRATDCPMKLAQRRVSIATKAHQGPEVPGPAHAPCAPEPSDGRAQSRARCSHSPACTLVGTHRASCGIVFCGGRGQRRTSMWTSPWPDRPYVACRTTQTLTPPLRLYLDAMRGVREERLPAGYREGGSEAASQVPRAAPVACDWVLYQVGTSRS